MSIRLIFRYYWPHIKKYKKTGLLVFISYGIATGIGGAIIPLLYKKIIDVVTSTTDPTQVFGDLITTIYMLGISLIVSILLYRVGDYAMTYSQSNILKNIADDAFVRLQRHSYEFFTSTFTGTLVARVNRYVRAFEIIHDQIVFALWMGVLSLLFMFGVLVYLAPILALMFLIWLTLYILLSIYFVKKKIVKDIAEAEANSKTTGVLADAITNILNVKMFASGTSEIDRFKDTTKNQEKYRWIAWKFQNLQFLFQSVFIALFEFIGMYLAIMLWVKGSITAGTIVLMQIYAFSIFNVTWNIGRNITRVMKSFADAKEMVDVFERPIAVKDMQNADECNIKKGHIEIKNITFSYDENEKVFKNLSLDIMPGERVGIVGPSGAGKSTITKLLLRFANITGGEILIDGQNIAKLKQDDLRQNISYVPQEPILFHRSLMNNIGYSKMGATEEEIINAAKSAHAHEFIKSFPKGYNTLVGERGVKLSGGERQRVAIARAMLKDAPILILDEATSSLDSISEHYIQQAFDNLMEGRTTIVIAHRLSTIQKMDRIIVFEDGYVAEEGTHNELLSKKGLYSKLWNQQSHGFVA